jgi:AcrR family transcriptional regulator
MPVNPRRYHAPRRLAAAGQTRRRILEAAKRLFLERGYTATPMAAIAGEAGVALDTVYAAVGTKPVLFRLLIETAISGVDEPVPALERDYVQAIYAEPDPARKLAIFAHAFCVIQVRLAPLFLVLRAAAAGEPELAALWKEIAERRAANMRLLVQDLASTRSLEVSVEEAADVIWATASSEFFILLTRERGWEIERCERWLAASWQQLLLAQP